MDLAHTRRLYLIWNALASFLWVMWQQRSHHPACSGRNAWFIDTKSDHFAEPSTEPETISLLYISLYPKHLLTIQADHSFNHSHVRIKGSLHAVHREKTSIEQNSRTGPHITLWHGFPATNQERKMTTEFLPTLSRWIPADKPYGLVP